MMMLDLIHGMVHMNLRKGVISLLAVLLMLSGAGVALADFIDSFDSSLNTSHVLGRVEYFGSGTKKAMSTGGDILGGTRELTIDHTAPFSSASGGSAFNSGGRFNSNFETQTSGKVSLTYGLGAAGAGDLSSFDQIVINNLQFDYSGVEMTVTVTIDGESYTQHINDATYNVVNGGADMVFLFSQWLSVSDWSSVLSVTLTFNAPENANFSMAGISLGPASVVPEPGAVAVWLMVGLVGLTYGLRMYRRQPVRQGD